MDVQREFEGLAFGLADAIICFLGILIGVAAATDSNKLVIVAGIVGGIADAFGNAVGFYISQAMERGIQTYEKREKNMAINVHSYKEVVLNAVYSFLGTLAILATMLIPFLLFDINIASISVFVIGLVLLFILGAYIATLMKENVVKTGFEFVLIGVVGAVLSYLIGAWLKTFFSFG